MHPHIVNKYIYLLFALHCPDLCQAFVPLHLRRNKLLHYTPREYDNVGMYQNTINLNVKMFTIFNHIFFSLPINDIVSVI